MNPRITQQSLLRPRYWPTWLGLGCLWLLVQLPWQVQMWLGKQLGLLLFKTLKRRRYICCVNLELAFPELSPEQRAELSLQHFISMGQGLFETALSWWGNEKRLSELAFLKTRTNKVALSS